MKKIGLTGGMGSGKTTVANLFEQLGVPVYYSDTRAKKLMRSNSSIKFSIKQLLGKEAYHRNGYPNRKFIASKIFNDKHLLNAINNIIHPIVKTDAQRWFDTQSHFPYAIYESAIILDHNSEKDFDLIISVLCPLEIRIKRLIQRDKTSKEAILQRLNNQISDQERLQRSDIIIWNKDVLIILKEDVLKIHQKLSA